MDTAIDVRRQVDSAWASLRGAIERLGLDGLESPTPAGWSAKEMLAHVAFWNEAAVPVVMYMLRGHAIPEGWRFGSGYVAGAEWPGADAHNAREAAWAREQTAETVLDRLDASHAAKVEALATVTDAEVRANARYFGDLPAHYAEHLTELEGMARQGQGGGDR